MRAKTEAKFERTSSSTEDQFFEHLASISKTIRANTERMDSNAEAVRSNSEKIDFITDSVQTNTKNFQFLFEAIKKEEKNVMYAGFAKALLSVILLI